MKHKSILFAPRANSLLCHNACSGMKMEGQEYDVEHDDKDKERKAIGNGEEQKYIC